MSCEIAIQAENLSKIYQLYRRPSDRFKQFLLGHRRTYYQSFAALSNVSFSLAKGEVLGLVGRNGAGKSTLLQLICGTLQASQGHLTVNGRVAALLELGAGFNPEFTGKENVYLNASILGLSKAEIDARYEEIIAFADIGDFIHQPVKTYSSGMYVRLAFAVATSVDPDILVIDEALSVGDGAFARKSFDRIMQLREKGATILFCSHSMYHIQAICNKALWLERGAIKLQGNPTEVVQAFQLSLTEKKSEHNSLINKDYLLAFFKKIIVSNNEQSGSFIHLNTGESDVKVDITFFSDESIPIPQIAISIDSQDGTTISTTASIYDTIITRRDEAGMTNIAIVYPKICLLQGKYKLNLFLTCENLLHIYDRAINVCELDVTHFTAQQGFFDIPHYWEINSNDSTIK